MLSRRRLLLSAAGTLPLPALASSNWPQFRGDGSRGLGADNPRLPDSWSESENVAWRRTIPGSGWSSPVVWGKHVLLTSTIGPDESDSPRGGFYEGGTESPLPSGEHRWMVYCVDLESGEVRWSKEVRRGAPKAPRHRKNTYASETMVTDGQRAYAHFGDLATYCLDMEGAVVWSKQWPAIRTRWGYGTASSPALDEGRLYIVNDNEEQSYLVALDKETGKEIWRTERDEPTTWSTPFVWRNSERTEIVTAGVNKIRSYDLDGKLLWELSGMSKLTIPSPFSAGGLLYVSSGYLGSEYRPAYAIGPGASGDITLAPGETANESVAWSLPAGGAYHPSPLVYDGRFYALLDRGFMICHDAKSGAEVYGKQRISRESANFTASPWAYNGKIFCLDESGQTFVIQAGPEFKTLAVNRLNEMTMATPAIAGDSLLIRTYSRLYRLTRS